MSLDWRIYYADGTTFDSAQGDPEDAPGRGFICAPQPDRVKGRVIMWGWDYYYWRVDEGQWWGSDLVGLLDQLAETPRLVRAVKIGRNVSTTDFREIWARADADPDFRDLMPKGQRCPI